MTIDLVLDCDTGVDDALAIFYAVGEGARAGARVEGTTPASPVAVGPLSNIGWHCCWSPQLPRLVRRIVVMGGAVGVAGNSSQLAEANIWHDPEAAQLVLDAAWDVVLVGLETTMRSPMPDEVLRRLEAAGDARARFVWAIIQGYLTFYESSLGRRSCVPHDAIAIALAIDPELATYRCVEAFVETGQGRTRGTLVGDLRTFRPVPTDPTAPGVIRIVDRCDTATFYRRLLAAVGA